MTPLRPLILAAALVVGAAAGAEEPLKTGIDLQAELQRAGTRSQQKVDKLTERTSTLLEQYRQTHRELDGLKRYNDQVQRMVDTQEQELGGLQSQLDEFVHTQREVMPLLARMVDTLARFVELDIPLLTEERRQRVEQLGTLLDDPETGIAEKYRRVLEAYQIETEYGRDLGVYAGTLAGSGRNVDFLRVGRVALLYRTLDGNEAGYWDRTERRWKPLSDAGDLTLAEAYRVARKQSAPELLILPLPVPSP